MPKIELYTGSATGTNVPVKKSAIATNQYRIDFLLEGRMDNDNVNTASLTINPSLINNMASPSLPVTGNKFFADIDDSMSEIVNDLVLSYDDMVYPVNLQASAGIILTQTQAQLIDSPRIVEGKKLDNMYNYNTTGHWGQSPRRQRIVINKPPNFMPMTVKDVLTYWGVDMFDHIAYDGHQRYIWNMEMYVDAVFEGDLYDAQKPRIMYSEPYITPEFIELIVDFGCPKVNTDERVVIDFNFNMLFKRIP